MYIFATPISHEFDSGSLRYISATPSGKPVRLPFLLIWVRVALHLCYTQRLTPHHNDDEKDMGLVFYTGHTYRFEWSVFPTGSMVRFSYWIHVDVDGL